MGINALTTMLWLMALLGQRAHASEPCPPPSDPIRRLACLSEPALLKAMNPGLSIPHCDDHVGAGRLPPSGSPARAVFLSCEASRWRECSDIAEAILKEATGATVNLISNNRDLGAHADRVGELQRLAQRRGQPFNVLPVRAPTSAFVRDAGVFAGDADGGTTLKMLRPPRENLGNSGARGDEAIVEAIQQCSDIRLRRGHGGDERLPLPAGNLLVLPNGRALIGESPGHPTAAELAASVPSNEITAIPLPRLGVGHIDEVFSVVPTAGACPYRVLAASPKAMRDFIERGRATDGPSEPFIPHWRGRPPETERLESERIRAEADELRARIQARRPSGNELARLLARLADLENKASALGAMPILSPFQYARRPEIVRAWNEAQARIEEGKKALLAGSGLSEQCRKNLFVDVPVLWNEDGVSLIPNPVNGLYLNGRYMLSKPEIIWQHRRFADLELGRTDVRWETRLDRELDAHVRALIEKETGQRAVGVSTPRAVLASGSGGGGSFHCVTLEAPIVCER